MSNPWNEKESEVRKEKFLKEYEELVKKHDVALMAFPQLVPSGQKGFNMAASLAALDKRNISVPSPIQGDNGLVI